MKDLFVFKNENLLRMALTHRSYVNENPNGGEDNERLEFLGDAILNFLSGSYLYRQHPDLGEDELTRRRAALVDEKQLANFAIALGLDAKILLGKGAQRDGGNKSDNLLSCVFEAIKLKKNITNLGLMIVNDDIHNITKENLNRIIEIIFNKRNYI